MSTSRCEFCGLTDHAALVQCVHNGCNLWFCNGNKEKKINRECKSHIMEHLDMSRHREVSVANRGRLICREPGCKKTNIFELRLHKGIGPSLEMDIVCCSCEPLAHDPVVDPHDESSLAQCINRKIVVVTLDAEGAKEFNKDDVNRESDKIIEKFGIRSPQKTWIDPTRKQEFESAIEYCDYFSQLEHLQSSKNAAQALLQPRMENTTIYLPADEDYVKDMIFGTHSQIDSKVLKNGTLLSVFVERHGAVMTYEAYVKGISADEPKGQWVKQYVTEPNCETGRLFVSISIRNDGIRREFLDGILSVEVSTDDTALNRRLRAGKQLVSDKSEMSSNLKKQILGGTKPPQKYYEQFPLTSSNLDTEQRMAVSMILESSLCLIDGAAGTGKTKVMIEAEKARRSMGKITLPSLYCANNNFAVGHLALKLAAAFGADHVTRITSESYSSVKESQELTELNLEYKFRRVLHKEENQTQDRTTCDNIKRDIIEKSKFVCCTCNMAGSRLLKNMIFGTVAIDEATQASELETLIPIMKGSKTVNIVLLGDTKQLGVSTHHDMKLTSLSVSMFERLLQRKSVPTCTLTKQYRMHHSLWPPLATVFYGIDMEKDGNLVSGEQETDKKSVLQRRSGSNGHVELEELHAIAIQMDSFHDIATDGNSIVNRQEAEAVTNMIIALLRLASLPTTTSVDRITAKDIGVISCYAGQITLIERLLKEHTCISAEDRKDLSVRTVDGFQGQERKFIILSTVRSGNLNKHKGDLGFMADELRINVALSRQKATLVIFGNLKYLGKNHESWQSLLSFYPRISSTDAMITINACQQRGCGSSCKSCLVSKGEGHHFPDPDLPPELIFQNVQVPSPRMPTTASRKESSGVSHESTDINTKNPIRKVKKRKIVQSGAHKLILTYRQLESGGYPLLFRKQSNLNKDGSDGHFYMAFAHQIQEYQITHATRKCDRCSKNYDVGTDGIYLNYEACYAPEHPGKKIYVNGQVFHSCCNKKVDGTKNHCSNGTYPGHISKSYAGMSKFRSTHTVEPTGRALADKRKFKVLGFDSEMVYTTKGLELARVSIVNSTDLKPVYDVFVKVEGVVLDYKEPFSGIKKEDIEGPDAKTLSEVHADLLGPIIHKDTILVGHSLQYDLLALRLVHTLVVDTAILFMEGTYTPGLVELAGKHLGSGLQRENGGHNSVADAEACMDLVMKKLMP